MFISGKKERMKDRKGNKMKEISEVDKVKGKNSCITRRTERMRGGLNKEECDRERESSIYLRKREEMNQEKAIKIIWVVWQSEAVRNWKGERVLKKKKSLLIWERHEETALKERQDEEITVLAVKKDWKGKKSKERENSL